MVDAPRWISTSNYVRLLTRDRLFWKVLGNTVKYVVLGLPLGIVVPLLLAVLLNRRMRGVSIYRAAFFLPLVTSSVAVGLTWSWLYNSDFGLINYLLSLVGIEGPRAQNGCRGSGELHECLHWPLAGSVPGYPFH